MKRITLRVSEHTYRRWKAAAAAEERTLATWICRRVEGKPWEGLTDVSTFFEGLDTGSDP